jgi:Fe(3+) dicitrate transport protein
MKFWWIQNWQQFKKYRLQGNDYVAKFRINTDADAKVFQSLTAKIQYSEDLANETYLV